MKIQEVCQQLNTTKKAIYYYEKQGLIKVTKQENGYREFTEDDIKKLQEIILLRKLGLEVNEIKRVFNSDGKDREAKLRYIFAKKQKELSFHQQQLECFQLLLEDSGSLSMQQLHQMIDYTSIAEAIKEQLPGFLGEMLVQYFEPYLQGKIETPIQEKAYHDIIHFWDNVTIKIPLSVRMLMFINKMMRNEGILNIIKQVQMDNKEKLENEEAYEYYKQAAISSYEMSKKLSWRIMSYPNRKMKIVFQNIGYNDIFIPALRKLSPSYDQYYTTQFQLNQRVCQELGLYYDAKMIIRKKRTQ